jgi:hypothetical protein
MIKRVLFTSVLAAQFLAISAVTKVNVQAQAASVDMRADVSASAQPCDPTPCPECDAGTPPLAEAQPCDPTPCPECDAGTPPVARA